MNSLFQRIIDPNTNQSYAIDSSVGKQLLKQYIHSYNAIKHGGMDPGGFEARWDAKSEEILAEAAHKQLNQALLEIRKKLDLVKKAYKEIPDPEDFDVDFDTKDREFKTKASELKAYVDSLYLLFVKHIDNQPMFMRKEWSSMYHEATRWYKVSTTEYDSDSQEFW